jgi:hypothetical protein
MEAQDQNAAPTAGESLSFAEVARRMAAIMPSLNQLPDESRGEDRHYASRLVSVLDKLSGATGRLAVATATEALSRERAWVIRFSADLQAILRDANDAQLEHEWQPIDPLPTALRSAGAVLGDLTKLVWA